MRSIKSFLVLTSWLLYAALTSSYAQDVIEADTVVVTGIRDRLSIPHRRAHDIGSRIPREARNLVDLYFQAVSIDDSQPIPNLRIWLESEPITEQVPVGTNGRFRVAISHRFDLDSAELHSNVRRGQGSLRMHIKPRVSSADFSMQKVADIIVAARDVRKRVVP